MDQNEPFFRLLRLGLGVADKAPWALGDNEWRSLHETAARQSVLGVVWHGIGCLPQEQQPPMDVALQWASEAERIRGLNQLQNAEAARLTRVFAEAGRRSMILKGQANARLYPERLSRQPGDIDIWVEGGRENVVALLEERMGCDLKKETSYHHVHLPVNGQGVVVEVHFRPSSGNFNPITNRRLQQWLEMECGCSYAVEESFSVPSTRFALIMQLAHIQRHFLGGGIGLRQICDYWLLLESARADDLREVSALLDRFGLGHTAGALMWLLREVFGLDESQMLCRPDKWRGEWMLREVMEDGNFGRHAPRATQGKWRRFFAGRVRRLRMLPFDAAEMLWCEVNYWKVIWRTIPERIRLRSWSLAEGRRKQQYQ